MKRVSVTDFDGGVNDIDDAQLIADNQSVSIVNYEYRDLNGLKKRYGTGDHELNSVPGMASAISFAVWYPNRKLDDMPTTTDKIYIIHSR